MSADDMDVEERFQRDLQTLFDAEFSPDPVIAARARADWQVCAYLWVISNTDSYGLFAAKSGGAVCAWRCLFQPGLCLQVVQQRITDQGPALPPGHVIAPEDVKHDEMRVFFVERLREYRDLRREGASARELLEHDDITAFLFSLRFPPEIRPGLKEVITSGTRRCPVR
jgi:hypothetical protein